VRVFKDVGILKSEFQAVELFQAKVAIMIIRIYGHPPYALLPQEIRPYYGIIKGHNKDGTGGVW